MKTTVKENSLCEDDLDFIRHITGEQGDNYQEQISRDARLQLAVSRRELSENSGFSDMLDAVHHAYVRRDADILVPSPVWCTKCRNQCFRWGSFFSGREYVERNFCFTCKETFSRPIPTSHLSLRKLSKPRNKTGQKHLTLEAQKRYSENITKGICAVCGSISAPFLYCETHRKDNRSRKKLDRQRRYFKCVSIGLCPACGKPTGGFVFCKRHRDKFNARQRNKNKKVMRR